MELCICIHMQLYICIHMYTHMQLSLHYHLLLHSYVTLSKFTSSFICLLRQFYIIYCIILYNIQLILHSLLSHNLYYACILMQLFLHSHTYTASAFTHIHSFCIHTHAQLLHLHSLRRHSSAAY